MRLLIHPRSLATDPKFRSLLDETVSRIFGRVRSHLNWIDLYLTDVNGPKGGLDKRCRIVAQFRSVTVVVSRTGTSALVAVAEAAIRVRRLIQARLGRGLARRRRSAPSALVPA